MEHWREVPKFMNAMQQFHKSLKTRHKGTINIDGAASGIANDTVGLVDGKVMPSAFNNASRLAIDARRIAFMVKWSSHRGAQNPQHQQNSKVYHSGVASVALFLVLPSKCRMVVEHLFTTKWENGWVTGGVRAPKAMAKRLHSAYECT